MDFFFVYSVIISLHVVAGGEGGKWGYRTENVIIRAIRAHSYRFQYKNTPFLLKMISESWLDSVPS